MTFGPDEAAGARITSLEEYNKCLDYFQSQGYNEVDTARVYVGGAQEAFTAAAHWEERGLTLATKWYPKEPGAHKPATVREMLLKSLKELQTECVDIFYLHAADRSVPFAETLEELDKLHKEGRFVQLGLSNFTAFEVAEVVITCKERGWVRPTVYQGMYNAISEYMRCLGASCGQYANGFVQRDLSNRRSSRHATAMASTLSSIIRWLAAYSPGNTRAPRSRRKVVTATPRSRASCIGRDISKTPPSMPCG